MPRKRFDEQLKELNQEMIKMGTLCEESIKKSSDAALNGDMDLADELPELADQMNIKDKEIESICMKLLLQQQPVAGRFEICFLCPEDRDRYEKNCYTVSGYR